ncbi:MAG: UDP-2,3-diacylglucosamine diphosphatase LpxI [Planctomycetes bacterium]|nr:UDP-2,3-diacylglucosamine diphosphatase LpxI [Planctomycetota bacterium]
MENREALGLIAAGGRLPFLVAEGAKRAGRRVICVGLAGYADPALGDMVDVFRVVRPARVGGWMRMLRRHGVTNAVIVGSVVKSRIHMRWRLLRHLPDWRALRVLCWRVRGKSRNTDIIMGALSDELATGGIIVIDSTKYCQEHLATAGVLTRCRPSAQALADIERGWDIAKKLGELDIGQAVVIKEKEVIAVEAIEGTAQMLKRAGQLCRAGGWVLVKTSKPEQDMRFDVPCIGPETVRSLAEHGGCCIVVEADKTIIIDKPQTIELAQDLGIAIVAR